MQKKDLKETWEEQKEHLKQKFAALTDTNVLFLEGKEEEMIAKLQLKFGKTRQELYKIINGL
ncbi:hypothetical protein SAMN05443667_10393 [Flavobacterium gillisiae]|jgi:uncharacterized protein YjbJ (UPF0337 family)|uniref:General stress protein CsbD n=1 Tax=Flavobacterium gillisiae TaxID=150146 RepID=A0A1H3ZX12_9FLAO|nr:hypothetical protein [Flavobacterium gillisiae]SEA27844.1 hypothetical protein SAMN05443667_10393 [Flavobacterium gillisiae]|tara:strand:- start:3319 stop:3504 length:186 start_codon:yes stop_codon:yes gene_type:complete